MLIDRVLIYVRAYKFATYVIHERPHVVQVCPGWVPAPPPPRSCPSSVNWISRKINKYTGRGGGGRELIILGRNI